MFAQPAVTKTKLLVQSALLIGKTKSKRCPINNSEPPSPNKMVAFFSCLEVNINPVKIPKSELTTAGIVLNSPSGS